MVYWDIQGSLLQYTGMQSKFTGIYSAHVPRLHSESQGWLCCWRDHSSAFQPVPEDYLLRHSASSCQTLVSLSGRPPQW